MRRRSLAAALSLLAPIGMAGLTACAGLAPTAPPDLSGRLAVRIDASAQNAARSFNVDFDLTGNAERGVLRLSGPLGTTVAQLRWQPGGAELSDAQGSRNFGSLDALAQDLLGESLPMAALIDWLRGRPWAGAPSQPLAAGFEQLGWRIDLAAFAEGLVLATRQREPTVSVRARLERPA